jgi:hypothetical protein
MNLLLVEVVGLSAAISMLIGAIGGLMGMVYRVVLTADPLSGYESAWMGILGATVIGIEYSTKYVQIIQLRAARDSAVQCIRNWVQTILMSQTQKTSEAASQILKSLPATGKPINTVYLMTMLQGISENGIDLTKYTSAVQVIVTAQATHRQLTTAAELMHLRVFLYVSVCFYHAFVQPTTYAEVDATFFEMFTAGIARSLMPVMMMVLLWTLVRRCATEM